MENKKFDKTPIYGQHIPHSHIPNIANHITRNLNSRIRELLLTQVSPIDIFGLDDIVLKPLTENIEHYLRTHHTKEV